MWSVSGIYSSPPSPPTRPSLGRLLHSPLCRYEFKLNNWTNPYLPADCNLTCSSDNPPLINNSFFCFPSNQTLIQSEWHSVIKLILTLITQFIVSTVLPVIVDDCIVWLRTAPQSPVTNRPLVRRDESTSSVCKYGREVRRDPISVLPGHNPGKSGWLSWPWRCHIRTNVPVVSSYHVSGDRLELSRHFIPLRVVQDQNLKFVRHYYWDRSGKRPIRNKMNMDTLGQAIDKDKHFWFNIVSIE